MRVLLPFAVLACMVVAVSAKSPPYGLGILIDSSQKTILEAVQSEFPRLSVEGARRYSTYAAGAFDPTSEQNHDVRQMEKFISNLAPVNVKQEYLKSFEYHRMVRIVRLVGDHLYSSILLYFTDTIHSFNTGATNSADEYRVTIYYFLTNCTIKPSQGEILFRKQLNWKGHSAFCIMKSDFQKIFALLQSNTTIALNNSAVFTKLLRKFSLAFAIDASLSSTAMSRVVAGVSKVADVSIEQRFWTYGIFNSTNFYRFSSGVDVRRAFAGINDRRQLNISADDQQAVFNARLSKSIALSENGSVVFSVADSRSLGEKAQTRSYILDSVRETAQLKNIIIHSLLTNCATRVRKTYVGFGGIFCVTEKELQAIIDFIVKAAEKRKFEIKNLRATSNIANLLLAVLDLASSTPATAVNPTTASPKPVLPVTNRALPRPKPMAPQPEPQPPTGVTSKTKIIHTVEHTHSDHKIIVNNNFPVRPGESPKAQPVAKCDSSSLRPSSIILFAFGWAFHVLLKTLH